MFCIFLLVEYLTPGLSASAAFSDSLKEVWYLKKHLSRTATPTSTDIWNSKMRGEHFIRKMYSENPHTLSFPHMSILSDFKSLFTNSRWSCPQANLTGGYQWNWWRCLVFNRGIKFLQVYSRLKCLLPVILEKNSACNPQNALEILDIIFKNLRHDLAAGTW